MSVWEAPPPPPLKAQWDNGIIFSPRSPWRAQASWKGEHFSCQPPPRPPLPDPSPTPGSSGAQWGEPTSLPQDCGGGGFALPSSLCVEGSRGRGRGSSTLPSPLPLGCKQRWKSRWASRGAPLPSQCLGASQARGPRAPQPHPRCPHSSSQVDLTGGAGIYNVPPPLWLTMVMTIRLKNAGALLNSFF